MIAAHGSLPQGLGGQEVTGLSRAIDVLLNLVLPRNLAMVHSSGRSCYGSLVLSGRAGRGFGVPMVTPREGCYVRSPPPPPF